MSKKRIRANAASSEKRPSRIRLEETLEQYRTSAHFQLTLYVTGNTPRSAQAIANIRALLNQHLPGRHTLDVVDIYQQPGEAQGHQIVAAPTLIKSQPEPLKRLIGDLANEEKVLLALNLQECAASNEQDSPPPKRENGREVR